MQKLSKDVRRDQVVNAVLELIGRNGVTGLSTAAIAKEVGMSEANLYRHFQNKQEILAETVKRIGEELRENVASVTARQLPPGALAEGGFPASPFLRAREPRRAPSCLLRGGSSEQ
ncbi:TetR/AcrR family transcriptional regulator [Syntrophorhabdus aromaticivorans]|uniref:TetR/AcrR family transcriptional regulator n=1 Tax=Syntrophorhabdus aromaticivorans TaxID=328301 RepID=UPI000426AF62|nr:TetR/AcrR family transcriptional regulator [Syntrophorhabdus aromaticivorans]